MSARRLSRRAVLRGAGGVLVALPLLEAMVSAQTAAPVRRLVVFYTPNGTNDATAFNAQGLGTQFTLGAETAALEPLRDRLLVLSGINMESAKLDVGDLHSVGMSHMLTATQWVPAAGYAQPGGSEYTVGFAGGPSIDQHIAQKLGAGRPFASLEFGVQSVSDYGVHPFSRMSYSARNQPVPPEDNPSQMFKRIFGDGSSASVATLDQIRLQRRSVLDFVSADFTALRPRLGAHDQQKVDAHMTAIRDLEQRLAAPVTGNASCGGSPIANVGDPLDKGNFPAAGKQQMDLLTLALKCDMTRVASLQWSWARSLLSHPWAQAADAHHTLTHAPPSQELSRINAWFSQQLLYLGNALKATVEPDGSNLLDQTVVYWCSDIARGIDHDFNDIRCVLLGGCNGFFKTGQHVQFSNEPHNKLLVTLMNAMGVDENQFGDPKFGTGALTGVS